MRCLLLAECPYKGGGVDEYQVTRPSSGNPPDPSDFFEATDQEGMLWSQNVTSNGISPDVSTQIQGATEATAIIKDGYIVARTSGQLLVKLQWSGTGRAILYVGDLSFHQFIDLNNTIDTAVDPAVEFDFQDLGCGDIVRFRLYLMVDSGDADAQIIVEDDIGEREIEAVSLLPFIDPKQLIEDVNDPVVGDLHYCNGQFLCRLCHCSEKASACNETLAEILHHVIHPYDFNCGCPASYDLELDYPAGNDGVTTPFFANALGGTAPYEYSSDLGVTWQLNNDFTFPNRSVVIIVARDANGHISQAKWTITTNDPQPSNTTKFNNMLNRIKKLIKGEKLASTRVCRAIVNDGPGASRQVAELNKQWPRDAEITIGFMGGTNEQRQFVVNVINEMFETISLSVRYLTTASQAQVRISFRESSGSWSYIGTDALSISPSLATMNFGWLDKATVQHEVLHMLSLGHEHQHPDREIEWNVAQIKEDTGWDDQTIQYNILDKYDPEDVITTDFDLQSVMLYAIPSSWTTNGFSSQWNPSMSPGDFEMIQNLYPKQEEPENPGEPGEDGELGTLGIQLLNLIYNDRGAYRITRTTHLLIGKALGLDLRGRGTTFQIIQVIKAKLDELLLTTQGS